MWKDESLGAEFEYQDIPPDYADQAADYRNRLIEAAVEFNDEAMEAYLDSESPTRNA